MAFKVGEDVIVPLSHCPECGHKLDAANVVEEGEIQGTQPEPGDFTICLNCGHLMVFTEGLKLREPNDEEARIIAGDKRMLAIQRARAIVLRERAYVEDAIRSGARQVGVYLTHENFNELVDNAMSKAARAAR